MKDHENYPDLLKVPDSVIIKELRIELGKSNAYIAELEYELKLAQDKRVVLKTHNIGLENKNKKLTDIKHSLTFENFELKNRIKKLHLERIKL